MFFSVVFSLVVLQFSITCPTIWVSLRFWWTITQSPIRNDCSICMESPIKTSRITFRRAIPKTIPKPRCSPNSGNGFIKHSGQYTHDCYPEKKHPCKIFEDVVLVFRKCLQSRHPKQNSYRSLNKKCSWQPYTNLRPVFKNYPAYSEKFAKNRLYNSSLPTSIIKLKR